MRRNHLLHLLLCLALLVPTAAEASRLVIRSKLPYWRVGQRDTTLSRMCSSGNFNQTEPERYIAEFTGPTDPGVLGIAKGDGTNLRDPSHAAKSSESYFFLGDGTSNCTVFVGGRKAPPPVVPPKAAAAKPAAAKPIPGPTAPVAPGPAPVSAAPGGPTKP